MSLMDLFWMVLFAALIAYWLNAMRAKELARYEAKRLCQQSAVLLLDDTVSLQRLRLKRNSFGQMSFLRTYDFEFSTTGPSLPAILEAEVHYYLVSESRLKRIGYDSREPTHFEVFKQRIELQPQTDGEG